MYYLNSSGYLVSSTSEAATFVFSESLNSDGAYQSGWDLGCNFTNPSLSGGSTGDIVNEGHIITYSDSRDPWERQVFFLNDERYAVRATNANSTNWGANTYWDVFDGVSSTLPEAGYSLTPSYVWQLEMIDNTTFLADSLAVLNDEINALIVIIDNPST